MLRATCSALAALIALLVASGPVVALPRSTCLEVEPGNLTAAVEAADVIVIAAVVEAGTERAMLHWQR